MRIALKFAYDGRRFHGYARQPSVRTVEGEILRAMEKIEARHLRFRSSSRTDKGVSALGNVLAFDTNFRKEEICGALNANLHDICFRGYAEVPLDFNPRVAEERWYRYHLHGRHDIGLFRDIAKIFTGKHNFSSFAKVEAGRNPVREISSIEISEDGEFTLIDIRAQSFLWQMVRRIVGAMLSVERGEREIEDIKKALDGEKIVFGIAAPEPLFLMDVRHKGLYFNHIKLSGLEKRREEALISLRFAEYLSE